MRKEIKEDKKKGRKGKKELPIISAFFYLY